MRLHEVLMDLQQQQLQQLSDWLTQTEDRIKQMESAVAAGDLDGYKGQIEQHKELQNDLEVEQVKVNSLTHMVVVVDENSGESATAALEEQLQSFFSAWLTEREQALGDIQTSNFKDPSEMNANIRRLATLKEDLEKKRRTLDQLSDAGQDVASLLRSPAASTTIQGTTEDLTLRWDSLVQTLEDCSFQVMEAVTSSAVTEVEEQCVVDTVAMAAAAPPSSASSSTFVDQDSAQPAKKRMMETDVEDRMELEGNLSALLSWMSTWTSSAQTLACAHPDAPCGTTDLHSDLKSLELQLASKEALIGQVTREGRRLVDQLEREGVSADSLRSDVDRLQAQRDACTRELQAARERVRVQSRLGELTEALAHVDGVLGEQDRWLEQQQQQPTTATTTQAEGKLEQQERLHAQCQSRLAEVAELGPRLDQLSTEAGSLGAAAALGDATVVVSAHRSSTLQQLRSREQELDRGVQALLREAGGGTPWKAWRSDWGSRRAARQAGRQAMCVEIEQTQKASDPAELQRWSQLSSRARDELSTLQCILGSLKDNQGKRVRVVEVERWLDGVQELMSQDATKQGEAERLQEELNQCKEYVNEMESVESALKQMRENVSAVQGAAVPGLASWGQDSLDQCQARWDELSKQRAKEDVLQKEVRVKILKDNINALVSRTSAPAGGGGQELTSELDGVLANYHKLCDRFKSKSHTLGN
ncbi:hypothetical protein CRUP_000727 [Coryphaenoides rupestris]|nr:hypothetical protein CRUP_000727 [Coryphaenoides rupestris]